MLVYAIAGSFVLLFGVLIFDAVSSSYAESSGGRSDVSPQTSESEVAATNPSDVPAAIDGSRRFGDHRPVDGTDLAA